MTLSRRDVMVLLPALAAAHTGHAAPRMTGVQAAGQATARVSASPAPALETLPPKVYHSAAIPYRGDSTKKGRRFFYGLEQSGYAIEMHETVLGPGVETHPPHTHPHQEIIIVVDGTVEVSMDGRTELVEAGSVIFYAPDRPHNLRNAGTIPCRYYVVELRGKPVQPRT